MYLPCVTLGMSVKVPFWIAPVKDVLNGSLIADAMVAKIASESELLMFRVRGTVTWPPVVSVQLVLAVQTTPALMVKVVREGEVYSDSFATPYP